MIYTIVFFSIAFIITSIGMCCLVCSRGRSDVELPTCLALLSSIVGICARIGWLITLSIMYKRIHGSWEIATSNQNLAKV